MRQEIYRISAQQLQAIGMLCNGYSSRQTAKVIGSNTRQVNKWKKDNEFSRALANACTENWSEIKDMAAGNLHLAMETLTELMSGKSRGREVSDNIRCRAALGVLSAHSKHKPDDDVSAMSEEAARAERVRLARQILDEEGVTIETIDAEVFSDEEAVDAEAAEYDGIQEPETPTETEDGVHNGDLRSDDGGH